MVVSNLVRELKRIVKKNSKKILIKRKNKITKNSKIFDLLTIPLADRPNWSIEEINEE